MTGSVESRNVMNNLASTELRTGSKGKEVTYESIVEENKQVELS